MEPGTNTPGAQRRFDSFMGNELKRLGVQLDADENGKVRWLKDRLQLPGIIRRYVVNHRGSWRDVVEDSLDLAVDVHAPEVVFLMEHTNCGERFADYNSRHGHTPSADREQALIRDTLVEAEELLQNWHRRRGGAGELTVIKAVGVVTANHEACLRRLTAVVSLEDYLSNVFSQNLTAVASEVGQSVVNGAK